MTEICKNMSHLRHFTEKRVQKEREQQFANSAIERSLREQSIVACHGQSEQRVERLRLQRAHAEITKELEIDRKLAEEAEEKTRKAAMAEIEQRLAAELQRSTAQRVREEQAKQRICDTSEELRAFREKLKAVQVSRERAAQLLELQVREAERLQEEQALEEAAERKRLADLERDRVVQREKERQRAHTMRVQQEQIADRENSKSASLAAYLAEKTSVDTQVEQLRILEEKERIDLRSKQAKTREEFMHYSLQQDKLKAEAAAREKAELKAIEEFAERKRQFEDSLALEKAEKEAARRAIFAQVSDAHAEREKQVEEFQRLRDDLLAEELEAKMRAQEEAKERHRQQAKLELLAAFKEQLAMREAARQEELREQEKFRVRLLEKFAEDDRIEQLNDQRRRMKLLEHRREAERLMAERREQFEQQRKREMEELSKLEDLENAKAEIIAQEKERLLREFH